MMCSGQKNISFHARDAEIDFKKFRDSILAFRNGDLTKMYEIRNGLNFKGEMSDVELNVLFIRVAEQKFSQGSRLETSIRRDIFLMSLGLLKGFSQCEDKDERRSKFLQESNYIAVYNEGEYALYSENEITKSIKDGMVDALRHAETRAIEQIAKILYGKNDCNKYSESLSEYYKCEIKNGKGIPDNKLPALRHPRKNVDVNIDSTENSKLREENITNQNIGETAISNDQSLNDIGEKDISTSGEDTLSSRTTEGSSDDVQGIPNIQEQKLNKEKRRFDLEEFFKRAAKISCILVCIIIACIIIRQNYSARMRNENIVGQFCLSEIINKADGIHLKPDESRNYTISVYPLESNASNAEIEILDQHVAHIRLDPFPSSALNQRNMTIEAQKEWDEKNHTTKIAISGNDIKDEKIPVTVDKPDISTSNKNNIGIFNIYEGDEGDRQYDRPMD